MRYLLVWLVLLSGTLTAPAHENEAHYDRISLSAGTENQLIKQAISRFKTRAQLISK